MSMIPRMPNIDGHLGEARGVIAEFRALMVTMSTTLVELLAIERERLAVDKMRLELEQRHAAFTVTLPDTDPTRTVVKRVDIQ